jgi:CheY-like chemotaxis protein
MAIAEKWRPDIVCFDVEMPTGNGLDVCEFLARDAGLSHVTFVVVSGRGSREVVRRCAGLRAHYIAKSPKTWHRLRRVLCDVVPELRVREAAATAATN